MIIKILIFILIILLNHYLHANKYFNDQEPWKKKDDQIRLNTIVYTTLEINKKNKFYAYIQLFLNIFKALKIFDLKRKRYNFEINRK